MKSHSFLKGFFAATLLLVLCVSNASYAQYLQFKPTAKASYKISQTIKGQAETNEIDSVGEMECDVAILSCNPLTMSYPFVVELTLKKIEAYEIQKNEDVLVSIKYSSSKKTPATNSMLSKPLNRLINRPMRFKIDEEFKVKEVTKVLETLEDDIDDIDLPPHMGLFGITPWTFELFLTQLFQLSGKDLYAGQTFPVNCYKLVNWEDDMDILDEREIHLEESSAFAVTHIDPKNIQGSWTGNARVNYTEGDFKPDSYYSILYDDDDEDDLEFISQSVKVTADATWDCDNPLVQQRTVKIFLEANVEEAGQTSHGKLNIEQTWKSS